MDERVEPQERRLLPKPAWVDRAEMALARRIPIHPHVISMMKLLLVAPLLLAALRQTGVLPHSAGIVVTLFAGFAFLDYLDGIVARARRISASWLGRILDRVTDFPLVLVVSLLCVDRLPLALVAAKLSLDLVLLTLFIMKRGSTENRVRTALSHTILLSLLLLSQGWAPGFVTPDLVENLLWVNVGFSAIVALNLAGLFQKNLIADALSGMNLCCGLVAILFASRGRLDVSVLFVILGALFDGCDGAAARRFGSTPWGVYSDDVADAVTYGLAPGAALVLALGGVEGWIAGGLYTVLTVGRLTYFTLNKAQADPNEFCGIPSTCGALVVLCSLALFPERTVLVGLMVGVAGVQMVSFDVRYRHLGRAMARNRRYLWGTGALLLILLAGAVLWSTAAALATILFAVLAYGFGPTVLAFRELVKPTQNAVMS